MNVWVFPGDEAYLEAAMEEEALQYPELLEIESGDSLIVYRIDTADIVGPFLAERTAGLTGGTDNETEGVEVPFDADSSPKLAQIERSWRRKELEEGGSPTSEAEAEILLNKLEESETAANLGALGSDGESDSLKDDESSGLNPESVTLLELSKAEEPIVANKMDFSGSAFGTLQLEGTQLRGADLSYTELDGSNFRGANLQGADLRGASLKGADFTHAKIKGADFRGANLTDVTFTEDLAECRFSGTILENANLTRATLEGVDLSDVRMGGANLRGTRPKGARFDRSDLTGARLERAKLGGASFAQAKVSDANLDSGTNLEDASFRNASVAGTDFGESNLERAEFEGADLSGSNLTTAIIDEASFRDANLEGVSFKSQEAAGLDFTDANLSDADLRNVDLTAARFSGARLIDTRFDGADINDAILTDAKASGASFTGANVERVAFVQTELFGADLRGASMYGALLESARIGGNTEFNQDGTNRSLSENNLDCYVNYDPRSDVPVHEGVSDEPASILKAMAVYESLEKVMRDNAYGSHASRYFRNRKELEQRHHRAEGETRRYYMNQFSQMTTDYGESLSRLGKRTLLVVIGFAFLYPLFGLSHDTLGPLGFFDIGLRAFGYGTLLSVSTFTGLGYGQLNVNPVGEVLATLETGTGVLFFALVVFVLTRQVSR